VRICAVALLVAAAANNVGQLARAAETARAVAAQRLAPPALP
jgi:hypothetical protein